jgi:hypothetical protein
MISGRISIRVAPARTSEQGDGPNGSGVAIAPARHEALSWTVLRPGVGQASLLYRGEVRLNPALRRMVAQAGQSVVKTGRRRQPTPEPKRIAPPTTAGHCRGGAARSPAFPPPASGVRHRGKSDLAQSRQLTGSRLLAAGSDLAVLAGRRSKPFRGSRAGHIIRRIGSYSAHADSYDRSLGGVTGLPSHVATYGQKDRRRRSDLTR